MVGKTVSMWCGRMTVTAVIDGYAYLRGRGVAFEYPVEMVAEWIAEEVA